MTLDSWHLTLARQIANHYDAYASMIVGSVARGLADAYSDLDLILFWHEIPSESYRLTIAHQISNDIREIDRLDTSAELALQFCAEVYYLGEHDLKVDITHKTIASQQALIDDVTQKHDTTPYKLGAMDGLSHGLALFDNGIITQWQAQISDFPQALIDTLLPRYLHMWAHQVLKVVLIERNDVLYARRVLTECCEKIINALCLINRQYPPLRIKHLQAVVDGLTIKPDGLLERVIIVCTLPLSQALPILVTLVEATFDLIETQGYDAEQARTQFRIVRLPNHDPIKLPLTQK